MLAMTAVSCSLTACGDEEIDNSYSRNQSVIQLATSAEYVVLDENTPDATALTIEWNAAHAYGNEYITTYKYEMDLSGSTASVLKEYEDDGVFRRSYTHRELQDMLTGHFGQLTSTVETLTLTVTASFEGPRIVVPDIATASVRVKTYGPKQFAADRLYIAGTAVGNTPIELSASSTNPLVYNWTGTLQAGKVNFPVDYADELNALSPAEADVQVNGAEMPAVMADRAAANWWVLPADGNYRVTVNLANRTVRIVEAGSVIEMNQMFLAGSAVGADEIEITRTLENENLYAWRGELKAGSLYLPLMFDGAKAISIVPKESGDHDIHDGVAHDFNQAPTSTSNSNYWEIPADGTYRVVVDMENRTMTIRSAATDLSNKTVSYNNTVDQINPFTQEVTVLWMWGGFNDAAHDSGLKAGFQEKYTLKQSMADPNVFVYHGDVLPRGLNLTKWNGEEIQPGSVTFLVSNIENNVYAYGSTAEAKRNVKHGFFTVTSGTPAEMVAGQGDNRYACFVIPENCNYVCVDIDKLTVVFDNK
ncbi:MAG: SusE domain-containing protein [Muribaculaceae bacterium]|nr:SusE domain-containing protein [Muribaculaceae bacterium]